MTVPYYRVDAFINDHFSGNPAGVCLLSTSLPDTQYQAIAKQNNLPVTAFVLTQGSQHNIRWFTPETELMLCGHGTLAAAAVLFDVLDGNSDKLELHSPHAGIVAIRKIGQLIQLNFPAQKVSEITIPPELEIGLGLTLKSALAQDKEQIIGIADDAVSVQNVTPDFKQLKLLPYRRIIVTARSDQVDFVSRTFYPNKAIQEDAVTGASHCALVPYWTHALRKSILTAHQLSERGGELICKYQSDRVLLGGQTKIHPQHDNMLKMKNE